MKAKSTEKMSTWQTPSLCLVQRGPPRLLTNRVMPPVPLKSSLVLMYTAFHWKTKKPEEFDSVKSTSPSPYCAWLDDSYLRCTSLLTDEIVEYIDCTQPKTCRKKLE